jgi:2-polyprenyl-3-methyl-5-hydroxy-6-metoxy-1,4-benzoquinol methylase
VNSFPIVQCDTCGFAQVAQQPDPVELHAIYDKLYFDSNKYRDQKTLGAENMRRLKLLREFVSPGGAVLEAGCGSGSFLQTAAPYYEMYGFDLAEPGVIQARALNTGFPDRIEQGTLEAIPEFHGTQFDAICLWDTIEHVWNPIDVFHNMLARLKHGGHILFSTPDFGAPIARLMGKRWAFMTPPEHLSFLSRQSTRYLVREILHQQLIFEASRGKRVNLGFLLYKFRRVIPGLMPEMVLRLFEHGWLAQLALYVPTSDIQYVVIVKSED